MNRNIRITGCSKPNAWYADKIENEFVFSAKGPGGIGILVIHPDHPERFCWVADGDFIFV